MTTTHDQLSPGFSPSQEPGSNSPETPKKKSHGRAYAGLGSIVLVAGIGAAVAVAESGSSTPHAAASAGASKKPAHPSQKPHRSVTNRPVSSPTSTELPSGNTVPIVINGNTYSAGKLDPTKPVAVPYVAGQNPTKADVEILLHDIDVAITNEDLSLMIYDGTRPGSDVAKNTQPTLDQFKAEKQRVGGSAITYQQNVYDKDIQFDPQDPNIAHAIVQAGSNLDILYGQPAYYEYTLELGPQRLTLPTGVTEKLLTILHIDKVESTQSNWADGFQQ